MDTFRVPYVEATRNLLCSTVLGAADELISRIGGGRNQYRQRR
jgi:hypothetical protein